MYLPIPAADAVTRPPGVTDTRDLGDLGTKAQPPVEAIPSSNDGTKDRNNRVRAQDSEKKRRPRKSRGIDYARDGPSVSSQPVAGDAEDSEEWLEKGMKLRRAGDHVGALKAFAQAHYIHPSGRTIGQIGLARQSLREWKKSANALTVALETSHEWVAKNRKDLEEALAMVRSHIGRLLVTGPAGTDLYLDGFGAGRLPLDEIPMDEGEHEVRVEKAGMKTWSATVKITGRKTTEIRALLVVDKPASETP